MSNHKAEAELAEIHAAEMYGTGTIGTDRVDGGGGTDGFLLALGPMGTCRWGRAFGGSSTDEANDVGVDRAGDV